MLQHDPVDSWGGVCEQVELLRVVVEPVEGGAGQLLVPADAAAAAAGLQPRVLQHAARAQPQPRILQQSINQSPYKESIDQS